MIPTVAERQSTLSVGTLVAGCVAVCLAQTGLVLPAAINGVIQQTLKTSGAELSWVSDAFLVPIAMLSLTFGVLGDRYGRKKTLLAGSALMALGYLVASTGASVQQLWAGQALAGVGAAALFPSSLAIITAATPRPADRAKGLAAWTTALSTGALIAPPLSGFLVQHGTIFRAFGVVGIFAVASTLVTLALATDSKSPEGRALDWPGQITIAGALLALLFGVIEGPERGWTSVSVLGAFGAFVVLLAAFILIETRTRAPMLRLDLFRIPAFSAASVVAVIGMFGFLGGAYALSIRLGVIQHWSPLQAAWPFLVIQGVTPFLWPLLVRLLRRVGPRLMLVTGLPSVAAGELWLYALAPADTTLLTMLPALLLIGLGFGLLVSALTAAAVNSVPVELAGMASATTSVVRDLGQTLAPALIGTIALSQAAAAVATRIDAAGLPDVQRHVVDAVAADGGPLALATAQLGPVSTVVGPIAREALTLGYNTGFLVSASACVVGAIIAGVFLRGARHEES